MARGAFADIGCTMNEDEFARFVAERSFGFGPYTRMIRG
jgi:hypothetical protein